MSHLRARSPAWRRVKERIVELGAEWLAERNAERLVQEKAASERKERVDAALDKLADYLELHIAEATLNAKEPYLWLPILDHGAIADLQEGEFRDLQTAVYTEMGGALRRDSSGMELALRLFPK